MIALLWLAGVFIAAYFAPAPIASRAAEVAREVRSAVRVLPRLVFEALRAFSAFIINAIAG